VRDSVSVRPPGASRAWCRIKTKEHDALEVWFLAPAGHAKLGRFENFGRNVTIEGNRADGGEVLKLWMVTANHLDTRELKPLLTEHFKAFRRAFGDSAGEKEAG
jgi:excinuclease ABC subunit A